LNVLSLFDGMSCVQIALQNLGINVKNYYVSEIDKFSIKATQHNFPNTIQLGNITEWDSWDIEQPDLITFGSPCQGFSFAGKQLNFEDPRSALFFTALDILTWYKPKYFLMENVRMKKEYSDQISKLLGVQPVLINSALVSAQNRQRLYWFGKLNSKNKYDQISVEELEDKKVLLKDIIDKDIRTPGTKNKNSKILCGALRGRYLVDNKRQDHKGLTAGKTRQYLELRHDEKTNTLTNVQKDNNIVLTDSSITRHLPEDLEHRKLTTLECCRLQTVPDNYFDGAGISNTQQYKMLGNGMTVAVIEFMLSYMG